MAVAAGCLETAVVTEDGEVLWWGALVDDDSTEVLHGASLLSPNLVNIAGERAVMVAAGRGHVAIVTEAGCVHTFGLGTDGRLGNGTNQDLRSPRAIGHGAAPDGTNLFSATERATMVACGYFHTAAVTSAHVCYCWGFGGRGQLGTGDLLSCLTPTLVELGGQKVEMVACGLMQTCAVTTTGCLYTWGGGEYGQLGLGDDLDRLHPCLVKFAEGDLVLGASQAAPRIVSACCGSYLSSAVATDGALFTWGLGDDGQLGQGEDQLLRYFPGRVQGLPLVLLAAAGDAHMSAVTTTGQLWTWGHGKEGQLGQGQTITCSAVPRRVLGALKFECVVTTS